jgi:hypothetical protein
MERDDQKLRACYSDDEIDSEFLPRSRPERREMDEVIRSLRFKGVSMFAVPLPEELIRFSLGDRNARGPSRI